MRTDRTQVTAWKVDSPMWERLGQKSGEVFNLPCWS